jgi:hypothetical protein
MKSMVKRANSLQNLRSRFLEVWQCCHEGTLARTVPMSSEGNDSFETVRDGSDDRDMQGFLLESPSIARSRREQTVWRDRNVSRRDRRRSRFEARTSERLANLSEGDDNDL